MYFAKLKIVFMLFAVGFLLLTCVKKDTSGSQGGIYGGGPQSIEKITVSPSSAQVLSFGETLKFTVETEPKGLEKYVIFDISGFPDRAVAQVTFDGLLTAGTSYWNSSGLKQRASANVRVLSPNGKNILIPITVYKNSIVESIAIEPPSLGVLKDEKFTLQVKFTPPSSAFAFSKDLTWNLSGSSVSLVSTTLTNATFRANSLGTTIITASTKNGKIATAEIEVVSAPIPVSSVTINPKAVGFKKGSSLQLKALVKPKFATDKKITWISNNPAVVIDNNGLAIASSEGVATITASVNGKSDTATLEVLTDRSATDIKAPFNTPFPKGTNDSGIGYIKRPFLLGKTEVSYKLWWQVIDWAIDVARGNKRYDQYWLSGGREGSKGKGGKPPSADKNQPVIGITWYQAVLWCNAFTEYSNAHWGTNYTTVYNDGATPNSGQPIRTIADMKSKLKNFNTPDDLTGTGYRLPTSNEWEFVARLRGDSTNSVSGKNVTIDGVPYYFTKGNSLSGANYSHNDANDQYGNPAQSNNSVLAIYGYYTIQTGSGKEPKKTGLPTFDIGSKHPNHLGLYDMSGNVAEWCFDGTFENRSLRGGAFDNNTSYLQIGKNTVSDPNFAFALTHLSSGLRVARTLP